MLSIDIGSEFFLILSTLPFFTVITVSAIGAIAELWVMTTTVILYIFEVSANSFKIDFPVL